MSCRSEVFEIVMNYAPIVCAIINVLTFVLILYAIFLVRKM